jgi:dCMP deaminase
MKMIDLGLPTQRADILRVPVVTVKDAFPPMSDELLEGYKTLMKLAVGASRQSPDQSTQNSAVLCGRGTHYLHPHPILSTWAVNEFVRGVAYTDERWGRPQKYEWIEHAERNSILAAARQGIRTDGLTMVCPWAACSDCARAIIQSGVSRLVTLRPISTDTNERWDATILIAMTMLEEAGVDIVSIDGPLDLPFTIRRNGKDVNL